MAGFELLAPPEIQRRMRFEGCGDQHDFPTHGVSGHAPFDGLLGVRKDGMNALADLLEDWPGERLRLGDVRVDARLAVHKMPPPRISRTTPMAITSRLRFRPAVPREMTPMPAPMIAKGMISQLSQPSSGKKATSAQISATKPTSSEAMLNMLKAVPSF